MGSYHPASLPGSHHKPWQSGRLFRSSVSYFNQEPAQRGAKESSLSLQFPANEGPHPGPGTCFYCATDDPNGKCVPEVDTWNAPTWQALNFAITDPHFFVYQYVSSGSVTTAMFTARAHADLDGDNVCSTFERSGFVTSDLNVQGSRGVWRHLQTE